MPTTTFTENIMLIREFLLAEFGSLAAEADGFVVVPEARPAWDAIHDILHHWPRGATQA